MADASKTNKSSKLRYSGMESVLDAANVERKRRKKMQIKKSSRNDEKAVQKIVYGI